MNAHYFLLKTTEELGPKIYEVLYLKGKESLNQAACFEMRLKAVGMSNYLGQDLTLEAYSKHNECIRAWNLWMVQLEQEIEFATIILYSSIFKLNFCVGTRFFHDQSFVEILRDLKAYETNNELEILNAKEAFERKRDFTQQLALESDLEFMTWHINQLSNYWIYENKKLILNNTYIQIAVLEPEILIYPTLSPELYNNSEQNLKQGYNACVKKIENNHQFEISTNIISLSLGNRHVFKTAPKIYTTPFYGDYWITEIEHFYTHADFKNESLSANKARGYFNKIQCLGFQTLYVPNIQKQDLRRHQVFGYQHGVVEAFGDKAHLDELGAYKVRFLSDRSHVESRKTMPWMPKLNAYAGFNNPLHDQAEVVLGFLENDPDRPFLVGAIPNTKNKTKVNQKNNWEHLWYVEPGHLMSASDHPEEGGWLIQTSRADQNIFLNSGGNYDVEVINYKGPLVWEIADHTKIEAGKDIDIKIAQDENFVIEKNENIQSFKGITLKVAEDCKVISETLDIQTKKINFYTKDMLLESQVIKIDSKNYVAHVQEENFCVQAGENLEIIGNGNADIIFNIEGADNQVVLSQNGDIILLAEDLKINTEIWNLKGQVFIEKKSPDKIEALEFSVNQLKAIIPKVLEKKEQALETEDGFEYSSTERFKVLKKNKYLHDNESGVLEVSDLESETLGQRFEIKKELSEC
ncbi:MAG: hypothetical protein ACKOAD_04985 [Gammaproteobacteria bacterium]